MMLSIPQSGNGWKSQSRSINVGSARAEQPESCSNPVKGEKRRLAKACSEIFCPGIRPPGEVPDSVRRDEPVGDVTQTLRSAQIFLPSQETAQELPMLPPEFAHDVNRYFLCTTVCSASTIDVDEDWANDSEGLCDGGPAAMKRLMENTPGIVNAFDAKVDGGMPLLPVEALRATGWVNNGAETSRIPEMDSYSTFYENKSSESGEESVTHLFDPNTGLSACIFYHSAKQEVIIAFGGLGSGTYSIRTAAIQLVQCMLNGMGFLPNYLVEGAKLVEMVSDHVEKINQGLPETKRVKITLVGHSMGGAAASYAALRLRKPNVVAVVTNPVRLGLQARRAVGAMALSEAEKYLTEIVVQGDWVADNKYSWLYKPLEIFGVQPRGPLGNARRFLLRRNAQCQAPHAHVSTFLTENENDVLMENAFANFRQMVGRLSFDADRAFSRGRVSKAVREALSLPASDLCRVGEVVADSVSTAIAVKVTNAIDYTTRVSRIALLVQGMYDSLSHYSLCPIDFTIDSNHSEIGNYTATYFDSLNQLNVQLAELRETYPAAGTLPGFQAIEQDALVHLRWMDKKFQEFVFSRLSSQFGWPFSFLEALYKYAIGSQQSSQTPLLAHITTNPSTDILDIKRWILNSMLDWLDVADDKSRKFISKALRDRESKEFSASLEFPTNPSEADCLNYVSAVIFQYALKNGSEAVIYLSSEINSSNF